MLNSCAELLLEKEKISKEEFEALFGKNETIEAESETIESETTEKIEQKTEEIE